MVLLGGIAWGTLDARLQAQEVNWAAQAEDRVQYRRDTEMRIRALETSRSADVTELQALRREITAFREDIRQLNELLRALERQLGDTR
jgi:septal ring factor EnvC (AmiA/AmiB activator)